MKTGLKIIGIIFLVLAVLIYWTIPFGHSDRGYWEPAWWKKCLNNFSTYSVPPGYEPIAYGEGGANKSRTEQYLISFKNKASNSLLMLSRVRGFAKTSLDDINFDFSQPEPDARKEKVYFDDNIYVRRYLPFFHFLRIDDLTKLPDNLTVKGISIHSQEKFSTKYGQVLYTQGQFEQIGFYKKMPFPFGFTTPVFDFKSRQAGALAIIHEPKLKETVFIVSCVPANQTFDEKEFKDFLQTVSFEKNVYVPYFPKGFSPHTKSTITLDLSGGK